MPLAQKIMQLSRLPGLMLPPRQVSCWRELRLSRS
nr:MAG TPA: polyhedron envelope protein [Caudoviricetes sp.]DAL60156.1 MAG TPA_asm: polyhedron envelope protein [Caudoviricetes sp.]DAT52141.1 MAG TPA: polyhedron envelope protein [Caudoviricetes sp.]